MQTQGLEVSMAGSQRVRGKAKAKGRARQGRDPELDCGGL